MFVIPAYFLADGSNFTSFEASCSSLMTLLPVLVLGSCDLEYEKEVMLKNPELYTDGPNLLLYNNCIFG